MECVGRGALIDAVWVEWVSFVVANDRVLDACLFDVLEEAVCCHTTLLLFYTDTERVVVFVVGP